MTRYSSTMREILSTIREGKSVKENPEDMQPASPDEGGMAVQQLEFMMHAIQRMKMHIENGGEFPEWMQNKLSGAHEKLKGLYANIDHNTMESVKEELDEGAFNKLNLAAKDLAKYAAKDKKGMDYNDFMKAAAMMKTGKVKELAKFVDNLDTEPRDHIIMTVKDALGKDAAEKMFQVNIRASKEIEEAKKITKKERDKLENDNEHGLLALKLAQSFGTPQEVKKIQDINKRHMKQGSIDPKDQKERDAISNKYYKMAEQLEEGKSSTGYELYHKDFSSAMKHAYDFAKKKFGIEVDPKEIDDKVASGPRKPSKGKTNSYRLMGKDGKKAIQVQVYGMDNGKYELNMYKEGVEPIQWPSQPLEEKLKVSDGLGAWIDDFKKSDAPQFQGKSDEEKKNMAIAAFTDAGGKLDEAVLSGRDYKVKDGKVHISKANFKKVSKDYKNDTRGKERMVVLDPKTQATVSMPVIFEEEEPKEPEKSDGAKSVEQGREDKKKTRIAQLQLQIAKAQETINKLNAQEKPNG